MSKDLMIKNSTAEFFNLPTCAGDLRLFHSIIFSLGTGT
jgi:hypothetical protein